MKGQEQPLLGLLDAQRLGIIQMNMEGAGQKVDTVGCLESVSKQPTVRTRTVSGALTQQEINGNMAVIADKVPDLFAGLGLKKVEPVHIEVDPWVKPIQQPSPGGSSLFIRITHRVLRRTSPCRATTPLRTTKPKHPDGLAGPT